MRFLQWTERTLHFYAVGGFKIGASGRLVQTERGLEFNSYPVVFFVIYRCKLKLKYPFEES